MLNKIEDIKKALKYECYESALALALTLPDICGRIEFPNGYNNSERYIKWCHKFLARHFETIAYNGKEDEYKVQNLVTPEVVWLLKNKFLYSYNESFNADGSPIIKLTLTESSMFKMTGDSFKIKDITDIQINIKQLCETICIASLEYYDKTNNKKILEPFKSTTIEYRL